MALKLLTFQDNFVFSQARYPAIISGIGTGKTLCGLLKIWNYCETFPDSLALIVRKEYTDLRDSTLKDFERYFSVKVDSNKEYRFPNGSLIMFRHGDEMNVLKNVNLSIWLMEQAEEYQTDETFLFLRDRLRRDNAPFRQGILIANASGHNWMWKLWVNNPTEGFELYTANTFDNAKNLPADFIEDLRHMEKDSPNHYRQYVMNSFEEMDADDMLFDYTSVYGSPNIEFLHPGVRKRVMGVDVARFGEDETVFSIIESYNVSQWSQIWQDTWKTKSTMETVGRIVELCQTWELDQVVIDDTGVGGGVTDRLSELSINVTPFVGAEKPHNELYTNKRAEAFFLLNELMTRRGLKILKDSTLQEQLLTIRFKYVSNGKKAIVSKDEMRKDGLKSPDRADALAMAVYFKDDILNERDYQDHKMPADYIMTESGM